MFFEFRISFHLHLCHTKCFFKVNNRFFSFFDNLGHIVCLRFIISHIWCFHSDILLISSLTWNWCLTREYILHLNISTIIYSWLNRSLFNLIIMGFHRLIIGLDILVSHFFCEIINCCWCNSSRTMRIEFETLALVDARIQIFSSIITCIKRS